MSRKINYKKFCGKTFELSEEAYFACRNIEQAPTYLDEVYKSYSYSKERVYNYWQEFFDGIREKRNMKNYMIGIKSHNSMTFSIVATFETDKHNYYFYITAWHDRMWIQDK